MKLSQASDFLALLPNQLRGTDQIRQVPSVEAFRQLATRRLPRVARDYLEGGADQELSVTANTSFYESSTWLPSVLRDVSTINITTSVLGRRWSAPIGLSPTGMNALFHPDAEIGAAKAALDHCLGYSLSTVASTSISDLYASTDAGPGSFWFQLYVFRDKAHTWALLEEARSAGVDVLELAVDAPVAANRLRGKTTGALRSSIATARDYADVALKPRFWGGLLNGSSLLAPHLEKAHQSRPAPPFDASLSWPDVEQLRARWPGKIVLKGLVNLADARRALDVGIDGFHLSNHGGRQLDRAAHPASIIPTLRSEVGPDVTIVVDSGIRSGADIATALALGADAAFVGRPYLWALAAGGQEGVSRLLEVLSDELIRTCKFLGVTSVNDLRQSGPSLLRTHPAFSPFIDPQGTP